MKQFYLSCALALFLFANQNSRACVDYHPDSIQVWTFWDDSCEIEIRVTNLQMFGGEPNHFCSCGIINAYSFDAGFVIEYVAFVDSTTGIAIEGFDPFEYFEESTTSWEDVDPLDFDWNGFVADVNEAGILAGQHVDLVIRGKFSESVCEAFFEEEEFTEAQILSFVQNSGFGTDEWDDDNLTLANSHLDFTYFTTLPDNWFGIEHVEPGYFETMDSLVFGMIEYTSIKMHLYPNPASQSLFVSAPIIGRIEVSSLDGKTIWTEPFDRKLKMDIETLPAGLYILTISNASSIVHRRWVKE